MLRKLGGISMGLCYQRVRAVTRPVLFEILLFDDAYVEIVLHLGIVTFIYRPLHDMFSKTV